jgi:hypothetical protein
MKEMVGREKEQNGDVQLHPVMSSRAQLVGIECASILSVKSLPSLPWTHPAAWQLKRYYRNPCYQGQDQAHGQIVRTLFSAYH